MKRKEEGCGEMDDEKSTWIITRRSSCRMIMDLEDFEGIGQTLVGLGVVGVGHLLVLLIL